jgi:transcriptional regulator with XRE-family HTH domain
MAETSPEANWYAADVATFGDRLAGAREGAGLSQEDLAQRLGVRLSTLRNWEEDLAEPRGNRLQMLAGMLNVSMRWLLTGEGEDLGAPDAEGAMTLPAKVVLADLTRLQTQLAQLSREVQQAEVRLRNLLQADLKGAA